MSCKARLHSCVLFFASCLLLFSACKGKGPQQPAAARPQIRATVVTIQTTLQPANRTLQHFIAIANGVARSSDEIDQWRLFDLQNKRVTVVDDIARTVRHETMKSLMEKRRAQLQQDLRAEIPRATAEATGQKRTIAGTAASQLLVRVGAYQRELWIGAHPSIPAELYSLMHVSRPPSAPIAGMMQRADDALSSIRGFPFADRSELPYDEKSKLIAERVVVRIEQRDVPADWLQLPRSYRDVTPTPATSGAPARRPRPFRRSTAANR